MTQPDTLEATELDHLAIAAPDLNALLERYAGDLGGGWVGMGPDAGFEFAQIRFGNGRRLELLEPSESGERSAMRRFFDASDEGPHHLTFRVPDVAAKVAMLEAQGFHPARVSDDTDGPEAVLDPKEATGVVVRLEEMRHGTPTPITPVPEGVEVPAARVDHAAHLDWIGHAVGSLDEGQRLFSTMLDGAETRRGVSGDDGLSAEWVEFEWPDGGRIRLYAPSSPSSPLTEWLGGRSGRLHHIALSVERPDAVPGAVGRADGTWEVAPERNDGVRLLLTMRKAMKQEAAADARVSDELVAAPDPVLLP